MAFALSPSSSPITTSNYIAGPCRLPSRARDGCLAARSATTGRKAAKICKMFGCLRTSKFGRRLKIYGDKMNDALAYTVAHNTAQKFLADLIEENSVLVGFDVEFADDHERDQIEMLLRTHGDDLQNWSRDVLDGARPLIIKYGRRIPRNLSFDNIPEDAEYSQAELVIAKKMELEAQCAEDPAQTLEGARPALQALVATWRGEMRAVGEAMLRPGFNVRGVPGMSKSQVSRSDQRVTAAFRALIAKGL